MDYDYEITYKNGEDNLVADALSRTFDDHVSLHLFLSLFQIGYNMFTKDM